MILVMVPLVFLPEISLAKTIVFNMKSINKKVVTNLCRLIIFKNQNKNPKLIDKYFLYLYFFKGFYGISFNRKSKK